MTNQTSSLPGLQGAMLPLHVWPRGRHGDGLLGPAEPGSGWPTNQLSVSAGNADQLAAVLRLHLGEGLLVSGGISSHTRLAPLQGAKLELGMVSAAAAARLADGRPVAALTESLLQRNFTVYVNKVPVADADLMATNGVIHAVNAIIRPLGKLRPLPG